jgi:hypothetical protein
MSQTELNFELRKLFKETEVRFPAQKLDSDTKQAYLQDWKEKSARVGFKRFEAGVKRARESGNYFPMICDINPLIPDSIGKDPRDEAWEREFKELCQRKRMGEKFWTGADVFEAVAGKVLNGEIKPTDPGWYEWAKHFKASAQRAK